MAYDESFAEALEDSTYLLDGYDESYDTDSSDESYDPDSSDESYDEAHRRRGYRRPPVANGRYNNRPNRPYQGRATLNTPAGPASLKLPTDLVRKDELRIALAAIGSDIKKNSQAVLKINANLNDLNSKDGKSTHSLSKRLSETDRKITALQQQQLFSLLLPARIEEITTTNPDINGGRPTTQAVDSMKIDNTNSLLLTMMSGGFGGLNGGGGAASMLPMILLMTQRETTIGGSGGNNLLMPLVLMSMMNTNQAK